MKKRFETMKKIFETMKKRFETMKKIFETMKKRFETMKKIFETMKKRFETMKKKIFFFVYLHIVVKYYICIISWFKLRF
jgi:division protein CdvB (Snf7/Vps24/ESCRT-III family)